MGGPVKRMDRNVADHLGKVRLAERTSSKAVAYAAKAGLAEQET